MDGLNLGTRTLDINLENPFQGFSHFPNGPSPAKAI